MDGPTDRRTDGPTDQPTDRQTDGQTDQRTKSLIEVFALHRRKDYFLHIDLILGHFNFFKGYADCWQIILINFFSGFEICLKFSFLIAADFFR